MFPRADIVGTRPVASVEATKPIIPAGDAHQELAQRLNRIALGTSFQAEVLSHLTDGTFLVKVADTAVRMNLPAGPQVGETLDLTLIATEPRVAFLLNSAAGENNTTTLSSAGRLIDWILHTAQASGAPQALTGKTPLLPSPDAPPEQLARTMKDTLSSSGLFYESHVEQWANGKRPLASLLLEPQAKNSNPSQLAAALRAAAGAPAAHIDTAHLARLLEHLHTHPEAARELSSLLRAMSRPESNALPAASQAPALPMETPAEISSLPLESAAFTDAAATVSGNNLPEAMPAMPGTSEPASSESLQMINLQLNTLEQQRVIWQGELWPGQPIEWEVGEDTPHGQHAEGVERAWQSVVRFELPTLGKLSATVRYAAGRVQVQVSAANENTASVLRANADALGSALDAAGSPLELFTVKRDAPT